MPIDIHQDQHSMNILVSGLVSGISRDSENEKILPAKEMYQIEFNVENGDELNVKGAVAPEALEADRGFAIVGHSTYAIAAGKSGRKIYVWDTSSADNSVETIDVMEMMPSSVKSAGKSRPFSDPLAKEDR